MCNNRVYDEAWRRRVKASVKHLNHQAHLYHMFAIAFSTVEIHHYICFTSFPSHCSSSLLSILLTCNVPESAVDPRTRTCSPHFCSPPIHILGSFRTWCLISLTALGSTLTVRVSRLSRTLQVPHLLFRRLNVGHSRIECRFFLTTFMTTLLQHVRRSFTVQ